MTVKTLFIGMEGATFTVLNDLTSAAHGTPAMPFLARVFAQGSRAKLRSTPNPLTPPAWVSLMTGRGPGHHGVFDYIRAQERGEDVFFTLYDARDCRVETIWSIASRQGKRVSALNFPFTAPPPKDLNGFMVPGFVPWRDLRRNSSPPNLYHRLVVEDARGRCLVRNPAFVALKGGARVRVDGAVSREPGCGVPKPATSAEVDESPEPWRQRVYEAQMPGAGGELKSVVVHQAAFTPPETGEAGVISVVLDITERKVIEENQRLAETVFQTAADAIMVTDATGTIKSVNPAFTAITGYGSDEAVGSTPRLLKSGRHDGRFYLAFWWSLVPALLFLAHNPLPELWFGQSPDLILKGMPASRGVRDHW